MPNKKIEKASEKMDKDLEKMDKDLEKMDKDLEKMDEDLSGDEVQFDGNVNTMLNSSPRMTGLPPSQNSTSKQNKTKGKGKHPPSDDESRDPTFIVTPEELPARPVRPKSFSTPKNYEQARRERSSTKFAKKLIFGSKIADKKKRKQSVRAFRPCPACGMLVNRIRPHFTPLYGHRPEEYELYKNEMQLRKGEGSKIQKQEILKPLESDLDIDGRPRDVNKAMKKAGLYKKCKRCPLLDAYQNEEVEELETVHEQTTSRQYRNNMSNVIEFCCSKEKGVLGTDDVIFGLKLRVDHRLRLRRAKKPLLPPASYHDCLTFCRSEQMLQKFEAICKKKDGFCQADYAFVLNYTIIRLVFSNAARPEMIYKSRLANIHTCVFREKEFNLIKVPNSKNRRINAIVLSPDDFKIFKKYQRVRRAVAQENGLLDEKIFCFVSYEMKKLTHHISENIGKTMKNNGFKPLLAYEVRRASCTSSRAAFFEKFAQAESSNAQLGSNVRGHSNLTSLKSYDRYYTDVASIESYLHLREIENANEKPLLEIPSDSQDRLDLEKAKDDLVVLDAECTVEHPVLVEEKTFEAKILIRNSKKPFKSYFVPLTPKPAEDEQWDKSKNYKKVKLGKPQRDYSDSWRFYVENFLFQNSEGFIMPMGHEEMDMFIPTKVLNDNSDPASLSKLRHKIYNIVSRYFSAMQYVALLRFCKRKTIKKFESDNDLIDHVQKVAKILRINLTKEQAKQIRYLKTMALEGDLGKKTEISIIDREENKNESEAANSEGDPFNETSVVSKIGNTESERLQKENRGKWYSKHFEKMLKK